MKKALLTFFFAFSLVVTLAAQTIETFGSDSSGKTQKNQSIDLGLSTLKVGYNEWNPNITRNELGLTACSHLSKNGLRLGPDTKDLMNAVLDAEFRTDPRISKWMKPSLLTETGRIEDSYWLHEVSGSSQRPTSSDTIRLRGGSSRLDIETGSSYKTITHKVTYLPTMETKTFQWSVVYSSTNVTGLSYERAFSNFLRQSGLPSFSYERYGQMSPAMRKSYIAVDKVMQKHDKGIANEVHPWMVKVHSDYLNRR